MTWARLKTTGRGKLRLRLAIEGFPYCPVTHAGMVQTAADGRQWIDGLQLGGKISQKGDPIRATIEASGLTFKFADVLGKFTLAFAKAPTATTWMSGADITSSSTAMTVLSTAGFADPGYLYIDSETVAYTITNATTFNLTGGRGKWDSLAQSHYIADGALMRLPEVTNLPTVLEGRRVRLYAYGEGDSATGDGTQIWMGIVSSEPRMRGAEWSLSCDAITRILDSDVGGDLGEVVTPSGITYHAGPGGQWTLLIERRATDGNMYGEPTETATFSLPDAASPARYATQAAFLAEVNTRLATICAAWDAKIYIDEWGDSYRFRVEQGAGVVDAIHLLLTTPNCDPGFLWHWTTAGGGPTYGEAALATMVADTRYFSYPSAEVSRPGAGGCPRGILGEYFGMDVSDEVAALLETYPSNRLYLGGAIAIPASTSMIVVEWHAANAAELGGEDGTEVKFVTAVNASTRSVDVSIWRGVADFILPSHTWTPASLPTIRLGREYGSRTLANHGAYDCIKYLTDNAAVDVNRGAQPMIQSADWTSADWLEAYRSATSLARDRSYTTLSAKTLAELITPDVQLAGCMFSIGTAGALTLKRVRLASPTETEAFAITRDNLITDNGPPAHENAGLGLINTMVYRGGYDPIEDESRDQPIIYRDVSAYGRNPASRAVTIEPVSQYYGVEVTLDAVTILAQGVLGTFGHPYALVSCTTSLAGIDATTIGAIVALTAKNLPDSDGVRGVSGKVGFVIGREIDLYGARIDLTVLTSTVRIAGYNFGATVTPVGASTTWACTCSSSYFTSGDTAANHLSAGDAIQVYRWDSATAGTITGYVTSVVGNVVNVELDGVWTVGADTWVLAAAPATNADTSATQALYCYLAASTGRIDFGGTPDADAFQLAP